MKEATQLVPSEPETTSLDRPMDSPPHPYNYGVDPNAENEIHLLDYWRAIRKRLWPLGDDIQFVPGHGQTSTFGWERKTNAFVADLMFDDDSI